MGGYLRCGRGSALAHVRRRRPTTAKSRRWLRLASMLVAAVPPLLCTGCGDDGSSKIALTLTEVSPSTAPACGGDELSLLGSGFVAGATVRLGDVAASSVDVLSAEQAVIETPPLIAGLLDVTLDNPDGSSAVLPGGFEALTLDLHFVEAPPISLSIPLTASVTSAAAGDFDGDGDVDVLVAVTGAASRLLLNDGAGNFAVAQTDEAGERLPGWTHDTRAVVAADFDADGDLDLYAGNGSAEPDSLYLNDGTAHFEDVTSVALPATAEDTSAVAVGDVDGDGRADLVVANATPDAVPLRVLFNRPGAPGASSAVQFEEADEGFVPAQDWIVSHVALADVDGDQDLDLLVATPTAGDGIGLRLLLGEGAAGLGEAPPAMLPPVSDPVSHVVVGDVDGDGDPEVVVICGPGQDRLLVNDGSGHFFDDTIAAMPFDLAVGRWAALDDLDRDADLDLVIANVGAPSRVYLNDGFGRYLDYTPVLPLHDDASVGVLTPDVDGDADQDIMLFNGAGVRLRLFLSVQPSPFDDLP